MTIWLPINQVDKFNADPDSYVAKHVGLTKSDYLEWVRLDGAPLCAGQTKNGQDCKNLIGHIQMSANEWFNTHREGYCKAHGG